MHIGKSAMLANQNVNLPVFNCIGRFAYHSAACSSIVEF